MKETTVKETTETFKFLIGRLKPQKNLSTGAGKMKFSKKFCVKPPALQISTK